MSRVKILTLLPIVLLACATLSADDLTGADQILCTAVQATGCSHDGECHSGPPWNLNIPQFIEIDLEQRVLKTTEASRQNRSTPIKNIERDNGLIVLQGYEQGRAFSFTITESTGMLTVAVARDDMGVVVFGACTPKN